MAIRSGNKGEEGKTGTRAVLGMSNGSDEVGGHFRVGKSRAVGRLLRGPEREEDEQGVEGLSEWERRQAILSDGYPPLSNVPSWRC